MCLHCRRNASAFAWDDNSTARPTLLPSGKEYMGPAYSHWGKVGSNPAEPNGNGNEFCALAGSNMYMYFAGATLDDRVGRVFGTFEDHAFLQDGVLEVC